MLCADLEVLGWEKHGTSAFGVDLCSPHALGRPTGRLIFKLGQVQKVCGGATASALINDGGQRNGIDVISRREWRIAPEYFS